MNTWRVIYLVGVVCGVMASARADNIIYSNTNAASDLNIAFSPGTNQIGDEVSVTSSGWLSYFDFQYYGTNMSGSQSIDVWLYQNDGAAISLVNRTAYAPGTVLFHETVSSTFFQNTAPQRNTLQFSPGFGDFTANSIWIDSAYNLTLAIQISGVNEAGGEFAGISLYSPQTVGGNYNSYWQFDGTSWGLNTNSYPVNFGMQIQAVPEPSMLSFVMMGGLTVLGLGRFFRRK